MPDSAKRWRRRAERAEAILKAVTMLCEDVRREHDEYSPLERRFAARVADMIDYMSDVGDPAG
jgi:hypothetical protein